MLKLKKHLSIEGVNEHRRQRETSLSWCISWKGEPTQLVNGKSCIQLVNGTPPLREQDFRQDKTIFLGFYLLAKCYLNQSLVTAYKANGSEKKRHYIERVINVDQG